MNIGIFTIVYNGYGRFIPAWCESISNLTIKPTQVVIALFGEDHGLTDKMKSDCYDILKGVNLKIINKGKHINIGTDRNKAVEEMETEWIMLLSADDLILPIAIEEFEKYDNNNVDVIACSYIEEKLDGRYVLWTAPESFTEEELLNWRDYWVAPYSPFRRLFWENHPYIDEEYPNIPMVFAFARANVRFARTSIPCVRYIRRNSSHSEKRLKEEQTVKDLLDQHANVEAFTLMRWRLKSLRKRLGA